MAPSLYLPVFLLSVTALCVVISYRYLTSPNYDMQEMQLSKLNRIYIPLVISIILIFWLGLRPSTAQFGDTFNYALVYNMGALAQNNALDVVDNDDEDDDEEAGSDESNVMPDIDFSSEWFFDLIMNTCRNLGFSVSVFFTIVEAGYILTALWAVVRIFPSNPLLAFLFVLSSLMFYSFGINGIRNGLACHLVLLAMSFLFESKYIIGGLLCLLALGIHRSTALPIATILVGIFFIKNFRYAVYIWIASIFVSLFAGNFFMHFFASLGFDDRMANYGLGNDYSEQFSGTGFRWDFLLYSSLPILMAWYISVRKNIQDNWYNALSVAYCLSNAFWVLVIRAEFSNRFAYLSWFMYPVVIAYPLINMPIWQDQDRKTGQILLAYCGFTLFMNFIYW